MKITIQKKLMQKFAAAAVFIFLCTFYSCSKSSDNNQIPFPPATDTAVNDSSLYIDITLDGQRTFGIQNGLTNQWSWGQQWGGPFSDTGTYVYNRLGTAFIYDTLTSLPLFAFSKGAIDYISLFYRDPVTKNYVLIIPLHAVDSFFLPGNYGYSFLTHDTSINYLGDTLTGFGNTLTQKLLNNGVNILWIDKTGKQWQTINGGADQTGSYFTIVSNEPKLNPLLPNYANGTTLTAKFDCKLYDDAGNMMHLTNGKFRLFLWF